MNLTYRNGDILEINTGVLIHGTNCSGGFGSGVAGAIRKKWPIVRDKFLENVVYAERQKTKQLGTIQIVRIDDQLTIINCYTQKYFGNDGKVYASTEAIKSCLQQVREHLINSSITELHSPKIGSGLGGLDWETDVLPIFQEVFANDENIQITIHDINNA